MFSSGEVRTCISMDATLVTVTSYEDGDHNCCYQVAALNKMDVASLIEELIELHAQMKD